MDDAFIAPRYAVHVAEGLGHVFSRGAPRTDGVTPLPLAWILAAFRPATVLEAFHTARTVSIVAVLVGAALLGHHLGGRKPRALVALLGLAPASLGAWAVGGLETGLAFAAVALAVTAPPVAACAAAGALGILRPEAVPLALVLAVVRVRERDGAPLSRFAPALLAPSLVAAAAVTRLSLYGSAVPLSFFAKPTSGSQGAVYVIVGAILTPSLWLSVGRPRRSLALAVPVHLAAVAWAGGDWMPLSRLLVPLVPVLVVLAADVAEESSRIAMAVRTAAAAAALAFQWVKGGLAAREVLPVRLALVESARGLFGERDVVAALDVGWLGAATDARIVDLAGLTDPGIARLPGGHTTKRVTWAMLSDRGTTHLVLLRDPRRRDEARDDGGPFSRGVEESLLLREAWLREHVAVQAIVRAGGLEYVVLRVGGAPG